MLLRWQIMSLHLIYVGALSAHTSVATEAEEVTEVIEASWTLFPEESNMSIQALSSESHSNYSSSGLSTDISFSPLNSSFSTINSSRTDTEKSSFSNDTLEPLPKHINQPNFEAWKPNTATVNIPLSTLVEASPTNSSVSLPPPLPVHSSQSLSLPINQDFSSNSFSADQQGTSCMAVPKCELLQYNECLGASLPYTHTSLAFTRLHSQRAALAELEAWGRSLRLVPRCWGVVQPYLCSVFFPPCDNNTNTLYLPPKDMCEAVRAPCALVEEGRGWPPYMLCPPPSPALPPSSGHPRPYPCTAGSSSSLREVKYNSSSGACVVPLVPTPRPEAWYPGVRGCGLPCQHPHFSREETAGYRSFLALMGGLCVACCAFTVLTYLVEWRCGGCRHYPSALLLYVCGCCLVAGVALLVQYHSGVRERVTCHADGTLRTHEPSTESNMSCVVVFVCLYYFGVAAAVWLLILAYSWHCFFTALVCGEQRVGGGGEKGAAYYHLVAWSLPLVLTITTLAMGQVSADNLHGVCFLSPSLGVRLPLLLVPLTLVLLTTCFFITKGMLRLCQLKLECNNILTSSDNTKVVESIVRLAVLLVTLAACGALTLYCHWHYYLHSGRWQQALRQYILCEAGLSSTFLGERSECSVSSSPSLSVFKMQVLAWTCTPLVVSSFCWTSNTALVWRLFIARLMGVPHSSARLPKQQLVGEAMVRAPLDACGRLSGSLSLNRRDFAGPKLAIEGAMNPAWGMRSLQQLAPSQRAASAGAPAAPHAPGLLNTDSEHSISTRYSIESGFQYYASSRQQRKGRMRRHSLDSQLSFHVSDVEREAARHTIVRFAAAAAAPAGGVGAPNRASVHSFSSRTSRVSQSGRRGWLGRRLSGARESRRGSYTSEDSSFSSVLVTGVGFGADDTTLFSNMMRRLQLSSSAASSPCPPAAAPLAAHADVKEAAMCSRATIGVQTSLEDQDLRFPRLASPRHAPLVDKATQVSPNFSSHRVTPTFKPYHRSPPRLFSRQASLPSSSEDINCKDDSPSGWKNIQNYVGYNGPENNVKDDLKYGGYLHGALPGPGLARRLPAGAVGGKDGGDMGRQKRKKRRNASRSHGAVGRRGAVAETSFVNSTDLLLAKSREERRNTGKRRDSASGLTDLFPHCSAERPNFNMKPCGVSRISDKTTSRGLDAETVSTVLDLEDFSDS